MVKYQDQMSRATKRRKIKDFTDQLRREGRLNVRDVSLSEMEAQRKARRRRWQETLDRLDEEQARRATTPEGKFAPPTPLALLSEQFCDVHGLQIDEVFACLSRARKALDGARGKDWRQQAEMAMEWLELALIKGRGGTG